MFQTIGHDLIESIAECLDLPLIQHFFEGKSFQREINYDQEKIQQEDEVEDLFHLLLKVKEKFPNVEAVSCGAILSDYQRNRVENICSRLNLISLTYLWRRDQSELLSEMIDMGMNSILMKTASMGLFPKKHLGKSLEELHQILEKLVMKINLLTVKEN
jgi:diphthine-ammonia ligase